MAEELNTKVEILEMDEEKKYGKFAVGPLERGYGQTLGNSLRRVLLSSLEGAAVSKIRIEGVLHEFSIIEGIVEDVPEIILNIKGVAIKKKVKEPIKITLDIKGPKVLTAGDLELDTDIEVTNKDHYIATLNEDAQLYMELEIVSGKGYKISDLNKDEFDEIGVISIDSSFTPVRKVNYKVENTRVGQITDYDKLILEVWTNGTVTAKEAISEGADILISNLGLFTELPSQKSQEIKEEDKGNKEKEMNLTKSLEDLDLSLRSFNCLKRAGVSTVQDIVSMTKAELWDIRNFGKKSLQEVEDKIHEMELYFLNEDKEDNE